MISLTRILEEAPKTRYGDADHKGRIAIYSVGCCWWTSDPKDLGRRYPGPLPCCPHCGSMLMQAPLDKFIEAAQKNPDHYGPYGLRTFILAHARNINTCHRRWSEYTPEEMA